MEESASLLESDLLICDWSAMAIEYALGLGKPVLFVDVPPRVRNPKYAELGLEPMEMRIRRELGTVLPLDRLADAPRYVAELLRGAAEFRERSVGAPGGNGRSTSAGASRWGRGRSPASPTSGRRRRAREPASVGRRGRIAVSSRRRLLRWASWFAVANAALLAIVGLRYLWLYARLSPSVAWGYALVAYVGHLSALAYVPLSPGAAAGDRC